VVKREVGRVKSHSVPRIERRDLVKWSKDLEHDLPLSFFQVYSCFAADVLFEKTDFGMMIVMLMMTVVKGQTLERTSQAHTLNNSIVSHLEMNSYFKVIRFSFVKSPSTSLRNPALVRSKLSTDNCA
jgi:hypothetical protein